ncbi:MAG TPA: class I SAM-dependent methyltransferase [Terriglobia bacterium]|nr:class I SAM-dependent methyltransferase [Terriglobia bacterium]
MTITSPPVDTEKRFAFGKNWRRFLDCVDDERIREAERSLREMLGVERLDGRAFLDAGSGSGLFSLAAAGLGASRIHSFDYDLDSVECTRELKRRYRPQMESWTIERGSVLDERYLAGLGEFDVLYSWGVLHHTGNLWRALELVTSLVKPAGRLFIAIYNDQGRISQGWTVVKQVYISGWPGKALVTGVFVPFLAGRNLLRDLVHLRNPAARYRKRKKQRGMSMLHDWRDWLGGYPFEVASRQSVVRFYEDRGFRLIKLKSAGRSLGNNEFVFVRQA